MCGICGVVAPSRPLTPDDIASVGMMVRRLGHRGPDGDGVWSAERVAYGHTRLAIIDVEGGRQPMFDETGEVAVTFNGEIYNFRELRAQLEGRGHRFATRTD